MQVGENVFSKHLTSQIRRASNLMGEQDKNSKPSMVPITRGKSYKEWHISEEKLTQR